MKSSVYTHVEFIFFYIGYPEDLYKFSLSLSPTVLKEDVDFELI